MKTAFLSMLFLFCALPVAYASDYSFNQENPDELPFYNLNFSLLGSEDADPSYVPLDPVPIFTNERPTLQINTLEPDKSFMRALYEGVETFSRDAVNYWHRTDGLTKNPRVPELIFKMQQAQEKNISYDMMAKYAAKRKDYHAALIFLCLKRHRTATFYAPEAVNFTRKNKPSNLYLSQFPHYLRLVDSIVEISNPDNKDSTSLLASWLHIEGAHFDDHHSGSYKNFNEDFYKSSYELLSQNNNTRDRAKLVYKILQIFENARQHKSDSELRNIGYEMLIFIPDRENSISESLLETFEELRGVNRERVQQRIAVLAQLVLNYFSSKKHKINPSEKRSTIYNLYSKIDLALPSSVSSQHLDNNHYAFEEFNTLLAEINTLMLETDEEVFEQVSELYND